MIFITCKLNFSVNIVQFLGQQYCWSDTGSCISETASTTILPNHLRSYANNEVISASGKSRRPSSNLETASTTAVGRKSYNNLKTTHYGLIDWPSPKAIANSANAAQKGSEKSKFIIFL